MEFLYFIGGVLLGIVFMKIHSARERIYGVIEVDHETEQCKVCITSEELSDPKKKIASFVIKHDAKISREKQSL